MFFPLEVQGFRKYVLTNIRRNCTKKVCPCLLHHDVPLRSSTSKRTLLCSILHRESSWAGPSQVATAPRALKSMSKPSKVHIVARKFWEILNESWVNIAINLWHSHKTATVEFQQHCHKPSVVEPAIVSRRWSFFFATFGKDSKSTALGLLGHILI